MALQRALGVAIGALLIGAGTALASLCASSSSDESQICCLCNKDLKTQGDSKKTLRCGCSFHNSCWKHVEKEGQTKCPKCRKYLMTMA